MEGFITSEMMNCLLEYALRHKQGKNEIMLTYFRSENDFSWYDKELTTKQMRQWRQFAKQNICRIAESFESEKFGKTFYCFVLQSTDEDSDTICPFGLTLDVIVAGYVYAFGKKENRDATMSYVMKNI